MADDTGLQSHPYDLTLGSKTKVEESHVRAPLSPSVESSTSKSSDSEWIPTVRRVKNPFGQKRKSFFPLKINVQCVEDDSDSDSDSPSPAGEPQRSVSTSIVREQSKFDGYDQRITQDACLPTQENTPKPSPSSHLYAITANLTQTAYPNLKPNSLFFPCKLQGSTSSSINGEQSYKLDTCKQRTTQNAGFPSQEKMPPPAPFIGSYGPVQFTTYQPKRPRIPSNKPKPYKCLFCGVAFTRNNDLQRHERKHTGEKPYKCNFCGADFTRNNDLQRHMRRHTGETPYKCEVCGFGFAQSGNLERHKIVHTGEKPYECDVCGTRFALKYSLKKHKKKHMLGK